ncbi:MAG: aminodeoxychorismate synthase component I, partial [Acetobacteraceae bacterium]|nr:aminodeoxychorismate synthase component I [Acetobacteraceae bacterium]
RVAAAGSQKGPVQFRLRENRKTYINNIQRALEYIRAGESYEVCLTTQIAADVTVEGLSLYSVLRQTNPAPFASYLRLAGLEVISASPERFVMVDTGGRVEAKPIKGTGKRGLTPEEDAQIAADLEADEKSRSENLMIVDLLRNDLGHVCAVGSVAVPVLMGVETYATVHQLVSTITGQLPPSGSSVECVRQAFPGGSMTGAPKIRTLEIIDALEAGPRGVYSGAIGYFGVDGAVDLNIVIRTIVMQGNRLSLGVGGAIVALSDPEAEFEEILLKARASIRAIVLAATGEWREDRYRLIGATWDECGGAPPATRVSQLREAVL